MCDFNPRSPEKNSGRLLEVDFTRENSIDCHVDRPQTIQQFFFLQLLAQLSQRAPAIF